MRRGPASNEAALWPNLSKRPDSLFASQSLFGHLLRGGVAFALLYVAIRQQHEHPVLAVLAGLGALVALRGCPMCWTIGLVETLGDSLRRLRERLG